MADKDSVKGVILDATQIVESDDVIVMCSPEHGSDTAIPLDEETMEKIEKLERYAAWANHRIGEFRVG